MKIGIQTWGSLGDIRPFLALAEGLQSSGHDVSLVITSVDNLQYESSLPKSSVRIRMIASPLTQNRKALAQIKNDIFNESNPVRQTQAIIEKLFLPAEAEMYEAAYDLCNENDLVIGHFFHYPLQTAAEVTGCPYVSVLLVHSTIPSALLPPSGMPYSGRLGNRLAWWLIKKILNRNIKKYSDNLRIRHGLKAAYDLMGCVWASDKLTLIAVSQAICEPKEDWPEYYRVCGFLNMPDLFSEGDMLDELDAFLSKGEAPVYMTFGSVMTGSNLNNTLALLIDAANKASVRAIIQMPGWKDSGLIPTDKLYFVDSSPHRAVFPRCKAVVHHGGAGTTQSSLLAGKPSIVVSHTAEQEFWGRELSRMGVSSCPIKAKKLTVDQLARNIEFVINSDTVNEKARKIGVQMRKEDGVGTAIKMINEKFMAGKID